MLLVSLFQRLQHSNQITKLYTKTIPKGWSFFVGVWLELGTHRRCLLGMDCVAVLTGDAEQVRLTGEAKK